MTAGIGEPPVENGSVNLSNHAYKALSEMIRSRKLRGGEVIIEAKLADTLGVSRTPLREALQRLEGEGLVVKSANRSFMVRTVDLGEYLQSLKVREILEGEAAALAAGRVPPEAFRVAREEIEYLRARPSFISQEHWKSDDRVHALIQDACGNAVMGRMIQDLRVTTRLFEIARLAERVVFDATEHLEIIAGLESGDGRIARRAAQNHIRSLYRFALENIT